MNTAQRANSRLIQDIIGLGWLLVITLALSLLAIQLTDPPAGEHKGGITIPNAVVMEAPNAKKVE